MVKVGCCGFSRFPGKGDRLVNYAKVFNLVEINQTFYKLPRVSTVQRWRSKVPEQFEFTVKANRLITHEKPFLPEEDVLNAHEKTMEICRALKARVVLFQTPASFKATEENVKRLKDFFKGVERPNDLSFVWEPRGKTWSADLVGMLCEELDLVHCVDPLKAKPATNGPIWYFRLHGLGRRMYVYKYSDEDLKKLKSIVERLRGEVYVLFNNYEMYGDAERFKTYLERGVLPQTAWGARAILPLIKDLKYPLTKEELLRVRGRWRFFWSPSDYKALEEVLSPIPNRAYSSAEEVVEEVEKAFSTR